MSSDVPRSEASWFANLFIRKLDPVKESQSDLLSDHSQVYELQAHSVHPKFMKQYLDDLARAIAFRDTNQEAVAGLFSHIGDMHMVHHIWAYDDLEQRRKSRDDAWRRPGWDDCVLHTG
ncbi:unnamed protein product [Protopolystoma xenopodis]|uniref:NIPSNAP domain-containing protein n=1 Tax=Protopolystoma xenopodis TaxID=117903 RepID=A0A448WDG9_9PLAT|nr:unnamed protein product [Protopolystoma xenopodis]